MGGARPVRKVTAFVTRQAGGRAELLVFRHPTAGIQVPGGTVKPGERWTAAALREAQEETGLSGLHLAGMLGERLECYPGGLPVLAADADLLAEPDAGAAAVFRLRRGWPVWREGETAGGYVRVSLREYDGVAEPRALLWSKTGWLPAGLLAEKMRRRFYHLLASGPAPERWTHATPGLEDLGHTFEPFWTPLAREVGLVWPQDEYLAQVYERLGAAVSCQLPAFSSQHSAVSKEQKKEKWNRE